MSLTAPAESLILASDAIATEDSQERASRVEIVLDVPAHVETTVAQARADCLRIPVNTHEALLRTHLEDLQSEMEAGARQITTIAAEMRVRLHARRLEQADIAGTLTRQITDLQKSVRQQLETLTELRREIRNRDAPRARVSRDGAARQPHRRNLKHG